MNDDVREKAFQEGQEAVASGNGECPDISGQLVRSDWGNGVVSAVRSREDIPEGLNPFDVGRCFYKLGIWPPDEGCVATGREFSGYLAEKDKQGILNKEKGNKQ